MLAAKTHVVALSMPFFIRLGVLRFIHIILAHGILDPLSPSPGRPAAAPPGFRHCQAFLCWWAALL